MSYANTERITVLEVKNTEVAFLGRAIMGAKNAYSVGAIDTRWNRMDWIDESRFLAINSNDEVKKEVDSVLKSLHFLGSNGEHQSKQCHDHFLSGIVVSADLKFPRYISCEFQRYHWFEILSSQSTMHTLIKVMSRDDRRDFFNDNVHQRNIDDLSLLVSEYNLLRDKNKIENDPNISEQIERLFHEIKANLSEGYELWLTFTTNYLQLATMLTQRYNHRLDDWKPFIKWIHSLPLFDYITDLGDLV